MTETLFWADRAWWLAQEAAAMGYAPEMADYAAEHPRPTLKATLIGLSQRRTE